MAKLPTVVSNLAPDLRAFVNRVREAIDGKGGNRLVSVDDLINGGVVVPGPGGTIVPPGSGVVGPPPAPVNVSATGGVYNIFVEWDDPRYFGHSHAEVWGADTNNLGTAVLLGMTPGVVYVDSVPPNTSRYYWVRFVNILDTAGPYNAVDGVLGQTSPDVGYLLDTLTNSITESQLFNSLGARINLIDGPISMAGSVAARLYTETQARLAADTSLGSSITTLQNSDSTQASQITTLQTRAANSESNIINLQSTTANQASTIISLTTRTTAAESNITSLQTTTANQATQLTTLSASTGANTTAIQQEATARANADGTLFSQYTVKIDTNGYVSGFGLASTANNATPFSDFAVRADRFYVASPSGPGITPLVPFTVVTTQQNIGGTIVNPGVYINGAFIRGGSITGSAIVNGTIEGTKLIDVSANKITGAALLSTSFIESAGYIPGSQGWKIFGNGTAEFAAASIRGTLTAAQINSNGLSIRDTSGNIILNAGTGNFTGLLNGTAASTVVSNASTALSTANTANSTANTANDTANSAISGLTTKLNNNARNVLSGSGGIAIGSLNWDTSGNRTSGFGIGITRAGIAAFNSSGGATFILNGGDGSASFSGTLSAAGGTFAGTLTAQAVNAVSTINIAGESVVTMDQFVTVKYTNGGNNTGTTIYTGSFNMASAGNVFFSCVSKFESNSPASDVSSIALSVGSSVYFAAGRDLLSQSVKVISAKGYFAAGPQTFEVQHTYQNIEADDVLYVTTITLMKGYR